MNEWSPPILFENPAQPKAMMISLRSRIWTSVVHPTPRQMLQRRSCGLFSTAAVPETNADALPMIDIAHPECNVSLNILSKLGRNLHQKQDHPLHIIKSHIETYFQAQDEAFQFFDNLSPIVSTQRCFDDLLTPANHVSRSTNDTYYVDRSTVLRTHTSAHQSMMLEQGHESFLVTGDVYRRDEIDRCHYPVFHQMEGVYLFPESQGLVEIKAIQDHLEQTLEGLARHLFGPDVPMRWVEAYFPFTDPSKELEIEFQGEWMEVLGSGVIAREILRQCGRSSQRGWAFGLGLERLAMVLFNIPDIRLFWSDDRRFTGQFHHTKAIREMQFEPFSKYSPCYKDVSFWLNRREDFHEHTLCELVRDIAGDMVEEVTLVDEFVHPKTSRESQCYRITYRHMSRNVTNEEIDILQAEFRKRIELELGLELR